ncbi:hypothetical protein BJF80_15845 [Serinicoccus sp. CUA-874]|nr:hypothetical protein BJF80_15845 [Serinicoccus sp. CUA-874]
MSAARGGARSENANAGEPEPAMLIVGEDRPDVEDTTVEELRRQRDETEAELAAYRASVESQLRSRQGRLDRAERRLTQRHGRSSVQRELDLAEQSQHAGIRGSTGGAWVWALGFVLLVLGVRVSGPDPDPDTVQAIGTTDEARVAWLDVAVAADEGRATFDEATARVADQRARMLASLESTTGASAPVAATGLAAAALAGIAFALPGRRKDS